MTNYNKVFDEKQYRGVTKRMAKYYLETAKSADLPLIINPVPDGKQYVHTLGKASEGATSGMDYQEHGRKMSTMHEPTTYYIPVTTGLIQIRNSDIQNFGSSLIADKKDSEIRELVKRIDDDAFHGAKNDDGVQLMEGIIGQITSKQNLTSGSNGDLSTKGEVWYVLKAMIDDIDFAMREEGPEMLLYMNEKVYSEVTGPDRIYNDKTEWEHIYDSFMGEKAVKGRKIGKTIITNKINTEATDNTDGDGADLADTLGTHGRMMLVVPDVRWIGRVVSRGYSLIGEQKHMLHVDQLYGTRQRAIVFDEECIVFTEQLTF